MMQENIELYCGDCVEIMKQLQDESVDLVVTSPPYNCGIQYDVYNDNLHWNDYYVWCEKWLKEIYRLLKTDGRFCLNHYLSMGKANNRSAPLMKLNSIAEDIGFKHHAIAIWWDTTISTLTAWGSWLSSSAPYINSPFEGILILYKDRWKKEKKGKTNISKEEFIESCSGIWKIAPTKRNKEHPATFPITLAERCIRMFSYENDLVLDPFMGIGTTGKACIKLNRKFIGIEISPKYYNIAKKELKEIL